MFLDTTEHETGAVNCARGPSRTWLSQSSHAQEVCKDIELLPSDYNTWTPTQQARGSKMSKTKKLHKIDAGKDQGVTGLDRFQTGIVMKEELLSQILRQTSQDMSMWL